MTDADRPSRWPELLIVSPVVALAIATAALVVSGQWGRAVVAGAGFLVAFFLVGIALDRYYRRRPERRHPALRDPDEEEGSDGETDASRSG